MGTPAEPAAAAPRATVTRGTFEDRLILTGELQAVRSESILVPRTPSWQVPIRWLEEDGARVTAGQKVLELDNAQFTGELEQNRLAASRALNERMQKEADIAVDLADKEFAVTRAGIELERARIAADVPPDIVERRDWQEHQLALARAEVALAKADEDLAAARTAATAALAELEIAHEAALDRVRTAERAIEALTLVAPSDGILVVARNRNEGRKFQVGDNVWVGLPVMSIPDLTQMQVEARLSDVDDGRIAPGMRATCVLDAYPDATYEGRVTEITPVAKEQGRESMRRAFRVTIRLDAADPDRMRPGLSVRATIVARPIENALLVPRAAVEFERDGQAVVTLADGTRAEARLGPCDALRCVVEEGLSEGQAVRAGA